MQDIMKPIKELVEVIGPAQLKGLDVDLMVDGKVIHTLKPTQFYFIVAGTEAEYKDCLKERHEELRGHETFFVNDPERLRGLMKQPNFHIIFYGTFRERKDWLKVKDILIFSGFIDEVEKVK